MIVPGLIFIGTYLVLSFGHIPGFRIDRTGAAIIGASLMVACGVISFGDACAAINMNTIILLFGMMIVVASLRLSGFFALVAAKAAARARNPLMLLAAVILISGVFSAFFVNDTMCLALTPLVLEIVLTLKRNPVPYLLAVAMAANVGSVATITGNPQTMLVGTFSGIGYREFAAALSPVAAVGLLLTFVVIALCYRREFTGARILTPPRHRVHVYRPMMYKSLSAAGLMIVFFFLGYPIAAVAIVAGAMLLITRKVKPEHIYREIDFSLLALFAGLFVVMAGIEKAALAAGFSPDALVPALASPFTLTAASAILANLVSNVPAVLLFQPIIPHLPDPEHAWLMLAMATTLSGNLTILGSVANLIVLQKAKSVVTISFREYLKVGLPLTLLTLIVGVLLLC